MKIVLLGPANVIHTQRWAQALAERGCDTVLATQHSDTAWHVPAGVRVVVLPHAGGVGYFRNVPALRRLLRAERPDLLNAHYASGYGTTAALAGFHPWLMSVWGSDVYDFPYESRVKGWWLRRNLRQADAIASTSRAMAQQVRRLLPEGGDVAVTPFGIDVHRFAPQPQGHDGLVIGTVKTLAPKYGIDVLLRAFALLVGDVRNSAGNVAASGTGNGAAPPLSLVIVGGGPQREELQALAATLGISAQVRFIGAVPHADVPLWLNRFDIYVAASRLDSESFGVAVLEASACGLPVVVSDVGGLPEVVADGQTGLVVAREDAPALARALARLVVSPPERQRLGDAGRRHVLEHYEWQASVDHMLACMRRVAAGARHR